MLSQSVPEGRAHANAAKPQAASSASRSNWPVLAAVGLGTFMVTRDSSVVNAMLPVLNREFGSDIASVEWVVTIYLVAVGSLLLTFGRLGDLRGHRTVYNWGFVVFIVGSTLAGLSPFLPVLIACRAMQALGSAMLLANSPAILTLSFPPERRGQVLGLQAMLAYLGLTAGPSLGGWMTDAFGWRSVFYVNLPLGLLALGLGLRFIPRTEPVERGKPFDLPGALTFMVALVALLAALNQGHNWGWVSPSVLGLFAAAAGLFIAFLRRESRIPSPMLELDMFRNRLVSASAISALLNYVCMSGVIFLLPFYLIQGRGLSPSQAGLVLAVQPIAMAIVAPISGALSDRVGARAPATIGMVVLGTGLFLLAALDAAWSLGPVAGGLAVVGLGTGLFTSPNNSAVMGAAPRHRQGIAAGVLALARNVGMVLGVALAAAILTTALANGVALADGVRTALLVLATVAFVGAAFSGVRGQGSGTPAPDA